MKFSKNAQKIVSMLCAVAVVCCMLSACGSAASSKDANNADKIKIGMSFMSTSDAVIAQALDMARTRAEELGCELLISDAGNDASAQLDAVENFIESGCDAIAIQPIDTEAMTEVAKRAMEKGIKVISYGMGTNAYDTWYKNDNTVTGTAIGEMAADWINENLGGNAKVCIIGFSMVDVLVERANAIETAIMAKCPNAEIVASFDAIDSQTGMSSMESTLAAHPEINVICAISDGPAVGAYEAVKAAGRDGDDFAIFGSDLSLVALSYIQDGTCYRGTTDVDNMVLGTRLVEMARDLVTGENKVESVVVMGCNKVTAENVSDYEQFLK